MRMQLRKSWKTRAAKLTSSKDSYIVRDGEPFLAVPIKRENKVQLIIVGDFIVQQ